MTTVGLDGGAHPFSADKAATVQAVIRGPYRPEDLPAQLIRPTDGNLIWLLDRDAAGALQ